MPLSAVNRVLNVNFRACARVAFHDVRAADLRVMREPDGRDGRFGPVAYLGGKLEERQLKMSLPENSSRIGGGRCRIISEEFVDKPVSQC